MKTLALIASTLAFLSVSATSTFAAEAKSSTKKTAKTAKMEHMQLMLSGATAANRSEIEKCAKESGAAQASLNVTSGELKVSYPEGKAFDRDGFTKKLGEKVAGVTIN